jgi:hypothetical protein
MRLIGRARSILKSQVMGLVWGGWDDRLPSEGEVFGFWLR